MDDNPFRGTNTAVVTSSQSSEFVDEGSKKRKLSATQPENNEPPSKRIKRSISDGPRKQKKKKTQESAQPQLPDSYKELLEIMTALDRLLAFDFAHKRIASLTSIRNALPAYYKSKSLTTKHLAQILTIAPDAFEVTQQLVKSSETSSPQWELVVTRKGATGASLSFELLQRKKQFCEKLAQYLASHSTPNSDSPPEIELAALPEPPAANAKNQEDSARDITVEELIFGKDHPLTRKAIADKKQIEQALQEVKTTENESDVSLSTLLKIRRNERLWNELTSEEWQSTLLVGASLLSKPEVDFPRLRYFNLEQRTLAPLQTVLEHITNSRSDTLTKDQAKQCIQKLLELDKENSIGWCNLRMVNSVEHLCIERDSEKCSRLICKANENYKQLCDTSFVQQL